MNSDAPWFGQFTDLSDWFIISKSILWSRCYQSDGVFVNISFHGSDVTHKVLCNWNFPDLNTEIETTLIEGAMSSLAHDHVGLGDTSFLKSLFSVCEHGQDDTLSTSASDNTAAIFVTIIKVECPPNNFGFHLGYVNKLVNMKRIGDNGFSHDIGNEFPVVFVIVVNGSGNVTAISVESSAILSIGFNPVHDLGDITTLFGHIPKSSGDSTLPIFIGAFNSHFVKLFFDVGFYLRDVGLGKSENASFDLDEIGIESENIGPEPCNESQYILGDEECHDGKDNYFVWFEVFENLGVQGLESFPEKSSRLIGDVFWNKLCY